MNTFYILAGIVVVFLAMHVRLIQRYSKTKDKSSLYMGIFSFFIALPAIFGILIIVVTTTNNLPLATLFYRVSTTLGALAYVFLNMFAIAVTNFDKKRGVWISLASFLIITFIVWAFNPIVEGVIGGAMEFTLTSMYKEPYGPPLIETILTLMTAMVVYPAYLFFRTAKDFKERAIRVRSFLMGIGLVIATAAYFIEVTDAISYRYMPIYRPMIFIGALTLFFGYRMPKWLERKLVGRASVSEKPVRSPLEQFFVHPVAPRTRSQLHAFSETLGLNHKQMVGRKLLFEFNPASDYEKAIQDFATEALANTEQIVIFTRRGSNIHSSLREYEGVKFFCLTQQFSIPKESSENEILLPSGDTSLILNVLDMALKTHPQGAINVIFDNLSDLVLSIGFDKTYRFVRYALEMLASPKNTALFLLNPSAHDSKVSSSLRNLFSNQITYGEEGLHILKLLKPVERVALTT